MTTKQMVQVDLDEDGFLVYIDEWSVHFVDQYAEKEGIKELTANHWKLITAIRYAYEKSGVSPLCRDILRDTGFTKEEVYALFPLGHRSAYKLAGLPKPAEC